MLLPRPSHLLTRMGRISNTCRPVRLCSLCSLLHRPAVLSCAQVLLLDEITVDLDVLGRAELMRFLQRECETRGATVLYATHIFDGLEFWPTHVAHLSHGGSAARLPMYGLVRTGGPRGVWGGVG